jgi:hypothetical protein
VRESAAPVRSPGPTRRALPAWGRSRKRVEPLRASRNPLRRAPAALLLILAVGTLQSLAWDVAVPAFQGPDEVGHYSYIQHVAQTGEQPALSSASPAREVRGALTLLDLEPLIGNATARPAWSPLDLSLWHAAERGQPVARVAYSGNASSTQIVRNIARNPPLYYAVMAVPYRMLSWLPLLKRLFVLRLFNALCYLATIALTWLLAGELFGGARWKQTLAAGAVALEPKLAFMSAVINADSLLIALESGFLLAAVRLVRRGPSARRVLVASALAAAASLTQGRGLVTIPVLAVAIIAAWVRFRPPARVAVSGAAAAGGTLGAGLLVYRLAPRSGGRRALYGGTVAEVSSGPFNVRQFLSSIYQFYFPRLPGMHPRLGPAYGYRQVFIETFYGTFASLEVVFPQRASDVLQALSAIGLVGLGAACVVNWRRLLRAWPTVLVMLSLFVVTMALLHYTSYRALLAPGRTDPLITGRYLLPMISLFGVAIAFTVGSLPRRLGPFVGAAVLSLGVLLSLGGLGLTMARFYG